MNNTYSLCIKVGNKIHGPYIYYNFIIVNGNISDISFETFDCLWANLIGLSIKSNYSGIPLSEVNNISKSKIMELLEGIPRVKQELLNSTLIAFKQTDFGPN
jgi:hypothetical protein